MINTVNLAELCQHLINKYRFDEEITDLSNITITKIVVIDNTTGTPVLKSMDKNTFTQKFDLLTKTEMNVSITQLNNYLDSL